MEPPVVWRSFWSFPESFQVSLGINLLSLGYAVVVEIPSVGGCQQQRWISCFGYKLLNVSYGSKCLLCSGMQAKGAMKTWAMLLLWQKLGRELGGSGNGSYSFGSDWKEPFPQVLHQPKQVTRQTQWQWGGTALVGRYHKLHGIAQGRIISLL